jgi:hypothetical protein
MTPLATSLVESLSSVMDLEARRLLNLNHPHSQTYHPCPCSEIKVEQLLH